MIRRAGALRPAIEAFGFGDRPVVDAGEAPLHQIFAVERPIFVTVGTEPLAAVVMPLIGEAHGDAVAGEGPKLLDQAVVQFTRPFAGQEFDDLGAANRKLGPVPPLAVGRIGSSLPV